MAIVVVERTFGKPAAFDDLQALEVAVGWCLEQHRVKALGSYLSQDGTRMVCVYSAPDAEAVRTTQDTGKLAYDAIWSGYQVDAGAFEARPGYRHVVVERSFDDEVSAEKLRAEGLESHDCMTGHRTHWRHSFAADRGGRTLCVFEAPDAESARIAIGRAGADFVRAWPAVGHGQFGA